LTRRITASELERAWAKGKHVQPETLILRQVSDYLRAAGYYVVRIQQGLGAHKGIADLVVMRGGRTIWVEIKTPRGRLSEWQERFAQAVADAGCEYVVVRSLEDAIRLGERAGAA
jgi:hypothetical protein